MRFRARGSTKRNAPGNAAEGVGTRLKALVADAAVGFDGEDDLATDPAVGLDREDDLAALGRCGWVALGVGHRHGDGSEGYEDDQGESDRDTTEPTLEKWLLVRLAITENGPGSKPISPARSERPYV